MSSRATSRVCAETATWPVELRLSICAPPTPTEGLVDLPAGETLGPFDRVPDRADGLVDVDDGAFLQAGGRHGAVADHGQLAVATDLADQRADLARADVDADEYAFYHDALR